MTRLIDADIFKENIDDICNLSGDLDPITEAVRKFMKNHIDGQTTVEAIPIDWIKNYMWNVAPPSEENAVWIMLNKWLIEKWKEKRAAEARKNDSERDV